MPTSRPIAGRARRWRAVSRTGTRWTTRSRPTTVAVIALRKVTAVATSTPWSKAVRAATWLAPIIRAISSSVAKAEPERAGPAGRRRSCRHSGRWPRPPVRGATRGRAWSRRHNGRQPLDLALIRTHAPEDQKELDAGDARRSCWRPPRGGRRRSGRLSAPMAHPRRVRQGGRPPAGHRLGRPPGDDAPGQRRRPEGARGRAEPVRGDRQSAPRARRCRCRQGYVRPPVPVLSRRRSAWRCGRPVAARTCVQAGPQPLGAVPDHRARRSWDGDGGQDSAPGRRLAAGRLPAEHAVGAADRGRRSRPPAGHAAGDRRGSAQREPAPRGVADVLRDLRRPAPQPAEPDQPRYGFAPPRRLATPVPRVRGPHQDVPDRARLDDVRHRAAEPGHRPRCHFGTRALDLHLRAAAAHETVLRSGQPRRRRARRPGLRRHCRCAPDRSRCRHRQDDLGCRRGRELGGLQHHRRTARGRRHGRGRRQWR